MLTALLPLLIASIAPVGCEDSTQLEDRGYAYPSVTPDAAPQDSCAWETAHLQNAREEPSKKEFSRASFSVSRTPSSPMKSVLRHHARANGWNTQFELRGDSLTRRQLAWNHNGWRLLAGDMNDPAMPLGPRWLPRRSLPLGWKASPEAASFLPTSSIPQGLGAGVETENWKSYVASAWEPVQGGGATPWEKPWELRQFTAGVMTAIPAMLDEDRPWFTSLQFSETRITRDGEDSVTDQLIAVGIASPQQRLSLNGAWSSTRQNPDGGFAAAAKWIQPLGREARMELMLRQRDKNWTSVWDPTYSPDDIKDSSAWGTGEGSLAFHIPFHANNGKGNVNTESWSAWNQSAATRKFGMRGTAEWTRNDARFEARGSHRQSTGVSGSTSARDFISLETALGRVPEWQAGIYRDWSNGSFLRQGFSLAAEARLSGFRVRPGMQFESSEDQDLSALASLWLRWKFQRGWTWEANGSIPCFPNFAEGETRWRMTLNYSR